MGTTNSFVSGLGPQLKRDCYASVPHLVEGPVRTWDELNTAFTSGSVRTASDEELLEYLQVCSTIAMHNDRLDALSINRTITLNAFLTQNFLCRENQAMGKLTWVVIVLAVLNVVGIGIQIWLALRH